MTAYKLLLKRTHITRNSTLGELYLINETLSSKKLLCYTLEDTVREVKNKDVKLWKIPGITAIPYGSYPLRYSLSNRFKKNTLELLNVSGFTGIRMHSGNTNKDTEGCILLGLNCLQDDLGDWVVGDSKKAVKEVEELLVPLLEDYLLVIEVSCQ